MLDQKILRLISARTGLGSKFVSKDDKISHLLSQISRWKDLNFALKGGTALNRKYLKDNARFSEDIDLDVFGERPVKRKLDAITALAKGLDGFVVEGPRMMKLTARFDAYYVNEFKEKDRVMLDIYFGNDEPISVSPLSQDIIESRLTGTYPAVIPSYSLEDLLAQKLIALEDRTEGKDVYDLFFGLDLDHDRNKVMKGVDSLLRSKNIDISEFRSNLDDRRSDLEKEWVQIMHSTNHFIPMSKRPEWRSFIRTTFDKIGRLFGK